MTELTETEARPENELLDEVDAAERLPAEIEPAILRKYFSLTRADLDEVERCRGPANKLGFSVQLCTLRWRGHFLPDTRDVPAAVLEVLAPQLGLLPMLLADYPRDEKTRWAHLERIRRHLGFVRCDRAQRQHLLDHLISVARSAPRTETLRRAAHAWLLDQHIVRPRRTTLRDLVASARETGLQQTYDALTRDLSEAQRSRLDGLLATPETPVSPNASPKVVDDETADEPRSRLDRFKVPPHRESPAVLLGLLERLETIEELDFTDWPPLADIHPAARRLLAGWGYHYDAWNLRRFQPPKRYAVLVCFLQAALAETTDAVVEAQDKLITTVHGKAKKRRDESLRAS
ncbi:MAG: DUF4158 domain-containing protein [Chloroflexota bacterium]|nr:DUF4158 domain-containing protein [Chloroflexota bacterium]